MIELFCKILVYVLRGNKYERYSVVFLNGLALDRSYDCIDTGAATPTLRSGVLKAAWFMDKGEYTDKYKEMYV